MQTIVKWTTLGLLGVGLLGLEAAGVRRVALGASEWLVSDEAQALARGSRIAAKARCAPWHARRVTPHWRPRSGRSRAWARSTR